MPARTTTIPAPQETSPLRVLAGIACVAVTVAAILVSVLAWKALGTQADVDRLVDDAHRSVNRLDDSTSDLEPAIRDLRDAAQALRETRGSFAP